MCRECLFLLALLLLPRESFFLYFFRLGRVRLCSAFLSVSCLLVPAVIATRSV